MGNHKQYEDMLYPQCQFLYDKEVDKTIDEETWKWLKQQARYNIKNNEVVHNKVKDHWRSIIKGVVPFGYKVVSNNA